MPVRKLHPPCQIRHEAGSTAARTSSPSQQLLRQASNCFANQSDVADCHQSVFHCRRQSRCINGHPPPLPRRGGAAGHAALAGRSLFTGKSSHATALPSGKANMEEDHLYVYIYIYINPGRKMIIFCTYICIFEGDDA